MSRRIWLLNLMLLALALAAAWQLRLRWQQSRQQEATVLKASGAAPQPLPLEPLAPPEPPRAAAYKDVALKMLFAEDRNPEVVLEEAPQKPMPPFPQAYGIMSLGGPPVVILSEKPGQAGRGYSAGEKIGEFTILAVGEDEVVFGWEGQTFRKKLEELKAKAPETQAAPAAAPAAADQPAQPNVQSVGAVQEKGPGEAVSGDLRSCVPGDTAPPGTVRDGHRKVVTRTPFGTSCYWEPLK